MSSVGDSENVVIMGLTVQAYQNSQGTFFLSGLPGGSLNGPNGQIGDAFPSGLSVSRAMTAGSSNTGFTVVGNGANSLYNSSINYTPGLYQGFALREVSVRGFIKRTDREANKNVEMKVQIKNDRNIVSFNKLAGANVLLTLTGPAGFIASEINSLPKRVLYRGEYTVTATAASVVEAQSMLLSMKIYE